MVLYILGSTLWILRGFRMCMAKWAIESLRPLRFWLQILLLSHGVFNSRWPHLEGEEVKVRFSITKVSAGENRLKEGRFFRSVKSKREESFDLSDCATAISYGIFLDTSWQYGGEEEKGAELLGLLRFRSCLLTYHLMGCDDQEVCKYYSYSKGWLKNNLGEAQAKKRCCSNGIRSLWAGGVFTEHPIQMECGTSIGNIPLLRHLIFILFHHYQPR